MPIYLRIPGGRVVALIDDSGVWVEKTLAALIEPCLSALGFEVNLLEVTIPRGAGFEACPVRGKGDVLNAIVKCTAFATGVRLVAEEAQEVYELRPPRKREAGGRAGKGSLPDL